jgi:N-acetyl-anhydromuramyl-L-alanine amidase AmpD
MHKSLGLLLLAFSLNGWTFSCLDPLPIEEMPIIFDAQRIALTQEYQQQHYGISPSITIEPKIIVIHWTQIASLSNTFNVFNPAMFPANSERRKDLPGELNVSAHFVVDRNGGIYQLMPEYWMARHVIGLNHYSIGIENVGGVNGDDLTTEQLQANAFLVCLLMQRYPTIEHVIGHNEYGKFKNTPLWLEKDPFYFTAKDDPGPTFVKRVLQLIKRGGGTNS